MVALKAFYSFDGESIDLMLFLGIPFKITLGLIMAESACEEFLALLTLNSTTSLIMSTA